jgi:uncharacterized LabA/DUF88 family protein
MSRFGTLVLYDVENLKTPLSRKKGAYIVSRVDLLEVREAIRKTLPSTHFNDIVFVKSYHKSDKRWAKNNRFFDFLRNKGFEVEEKITKKSKNVIVKDGKKFVYTYEECDMDANIIHNILTLGSKYSTIILLSGDDDMYNSLKYAEDNGTEIVVIAHMENMSDRMKEFDNIFLHDLLDRENEQNTRNRE